MCYQDHLSRFGDIAEFINNDLLDCLLRYLIFGLIDEVDAIAKFRVPQQLEVQLSVEALRKLFIDIIFISIDGLDWLQRF